MSVFPAREPAANERHRWRVCRKTRPARAVGKIGHGNMPAFIRAMRFEDARRFLEIQRESVRGIAARDYPTAVIEAWAPLPITDEVMARFLGNADHEIRLIAELDGQPVGIGALVLSNSELRA